MALSNATLVTGATISVTGGSTVTFNPSVQKTDSVDLIDIGASDERTQTKISCRSVAPVYTNSTASYSKGKRFVTVTVPVILANGETVFDAIRIEMTYHPEETAASRLDRRKMAAQVLFNASFDTFFVTGSRV